MVNVPDGLSMARECLLLDPEQPRPTMLWRREQNANMFWRESQRCLINQAQWMRFPLDLSLPAHS